jgi:integrase/recombinase XerD
LRGVNTVPKAYLEPNEIQKMEEAADYQRDRLLIHLLSRLGCRVSEVLGIAVDDIDFSRGLITIEHLKTRLNLYCPKCEARISRSARFCPGCGQKLEKAVTRELSRRRVRELPVDEDTLVRIKDYIDKGGPASHDGRQLLFGIGRTQAWKIVSDCAKKAGLPKLVFCESGIKHGVSPHRLRDAFAVFAVKQDGSADGIRLLQEHLGHQSITTTMRYRKLSGEEHREWFERVSGAMTGCLSEGVE